MTKPKVAPEGDYLTKVGVRLITEDERQRGGAPHQSARDQNRLDASPARAAVGFCGEQQSLFGFARTPALSQSGFAGPGVGPQAAQRGLAATLGASGGASGELRR